jgi:hypothetical protein
MGNKWKANAEEAYVSAKVGQVNDYNLKIIGQMRTVYRDH